MIRKLFVALVLAAMSLCAAAVDYPAYKGYVNDFANVLPDDREAAMEQMVRSYEQETSVEIAVVTTPSLGGMSIDEWTIGLAKKWGVGKKDKNNGLVLVVAPNERKYRFEVGFGLEGVLNDGLVGQIGRDTLPKAFKAGDYAGGIENALKAVIGTIGHQSVEERAQAAIKKQEEAKLQEERSAENIKMIGATVAVGVLILGAIFGVVALFRSIIARIEERRRKDRVRKETVERVARLDAEAENIRSEIAGLHPGPFPKWVTEEVERTRKDIRNIEVAIPGIKDAVSEYLSDDPDRAAGVADAYESHIGWFERSLSNLNRIGDQIKQVREQAVQAVGEAQSSLQQAQDLADKMSREGFRFIKKDEGPSRSDILRTEAAALIAALRTRGEGEDDKSDDVIAMARGLVGKVRSFKGSLDDILAVKASVEKSVAASQQRFTGLPSAIEQAVPVLASIKSSAPERVWRDVDRRFMDSRKEVSAGTIEMLLASAKKKVSMDVQNFRGAQADAKTAETLIKSALAAAEEVSSLQKGIAIAKDRYDRMLKEAESAIRQAASVANHGDVSGSVQRELSNAREKFADAKKAAGSNPIDWLFVAATLTLAKGFADEAFRQAQSDIDEAERERERKARLAAAAAAAATAAAEAAAADKRRQSSSPGGFNVSNNTPTPTPTFDGGNFGGAGADGDW